MKSLLKLLTAAVLCVALPLTSANAGQKKQKTLSINFENTELRSALEMLAHYSNLHLSASSEIQGTINYSFANTTVDAALKQIARENNLSYKVLPNGVLQVSKAYGTVFTTGTSTNDRSPASEVDPGNSRHIKLKYITVQEAYDLVNPILGKDDRVIRDQPSNSLIFMGGDTSFAQVRDTLATFDQMPQQILIEANIVEIDANKSRQFGFSYGDLSDPSLANVGKNKGIIYNPGPTSGNFAVQLGLGQIDGATLSARLTAAESEGAAKVLSRPKVVTINNKAANITSGISYSVRTVAAVSTGGTSGSTNTAGVSTVSAGLNLQVTPTVVGDNQVKLAINVSNSEPDLSNEVDGIPGIVNNGTQTEIIVGDGKTASVAGLVKNSFSDSTSGVPFLRKIPILGWLFSNDQKEKRDKELMVFITPRIIPRDHNELNKDMNEIQRRFPEVVIDNTKKPVADSKEVRLPASKN